MKYNKKYYTNKIRPTICDVCGQHFSLKDVVRITNKYSRQYGLVVCKYDVDPVNPQDYPITVNDKIISSPELTRVPGTPLFTAHDVDNRLPGQPSNGRAIGDPIDPYINLYWDTPVDGGSSPIIGYIVQRSDPQLAAYATIISNTSTNACFYQDTSAVIPTAYSYRIAAINSFGTGSYSQDFYWPTDQNTLHDIMYICTKQDPSLILQAKGTNYYIRINHRDQGVI